mgnify:CR=1 FL=1
MSRIGKLPVEIPAGVEVKIDGSTVIVKNGQTVLTQTVHSDMQVSVENAKVVVSRPSDSKNHKALHGLTRSLINNMMVGVSKGFSKNLDINGIGYKAQKQGNKLVLSLGFSHPVEMVEPQGITLEVDRKSVV